MIKKSLSIAISAIILTLCTSNISYAATVQNNGQDSTTISPYSVEMGGSSGAVSGSYEYYSYGVTAYYHQLSCTGRASSHYNVYLPSSFISKINDNVGNWTTPIVVGAVAKVLGLSITNPFIIMLGGALALDWATVTWKDNGNGVTLNFDGTNGVRPYKIVSGKNLFGH